MNEYDPERELDREAWQAIDELDRIDLIEAYHRRAGVELPNERLHATIHAVVENQVAMGAETPVEATLERLMREGLGRHDAIHAVGQVLASTIYEHLGDEPPAGDPNESYYEQLTKLTARGWLEQSQ